MGLGLGRTTVDSHADQTRQLSSRTLRRRNRRYNEIGAFRLCKSTDGELTAKARVSAPIGQAARR